MSEEKIYMDKDGLLQKFQELGITANTIDHPEVFTVETMMEHLNGIEGIVAKNLFLKDKKKKLYLLSTEHSRTVNLSDISKQVSASGGLRLADENILYEHLGVRQGCVTAYALINDTGNKVKFLCDSALLKAGQTVYFHPMSNAASTGISSEDFQKFLETIKHVPVSVTFDD